MYEYFRREGSLAYSFVFPPHMEQKREGRSQPSFFLSFFYLLTTKSCLLLHLCLFTLRGSLLQILT